MKKDTLKLVRTLAARLKGDWFINEKARADRGLESVYYIHDRKGLFITIKLHVYGKKTPQIAICYLNKRYKTVQTVKQIGCSLDKSLTAIKSDIESRLFDAIPEAQAKYLEFLKYDERLKSERIENEYIINSLAQVFELESHGKSYGGCPSFKLEGLDLKFEHLGADNFRLSAGVNLEKLIKMAQVLKSG